MELERIGNQMQCSQCDSFDVALGVDGTYSCISPLCGFWVNCGKLWTWRPAITKRIEIQGCAFVTFLGYWKGDR
jgi:hypothetical protein